MSKNKKIEHAYEYAKELYFSMGIDVDKVIERIDAIPISIHCWQGDDLIGFEDRNQSLTGGIQATGNYIGKPTTIDELRKDIEKAFQYIPGSKKLSLHAIYLDSKKKVPRDEIAPENFTSWVHWAKENKVGLDFNPTCFSHSLSADGFTLSHPDKSVRDFWIRHVKQSRKISEYFGKETGKQSINNIWIPDGFKDIPIDRLTPRIRLQDSLDQCLEERIDKKYHLDAVESKLFGIGSESYVVGSHEFYLGYAIKNNIVVCLDAGHFHPNEVISDKLSATSLFVDNILLHVSRPVRWDSDHVVILENELVAIAQAILRHDLENRIHVGLDFFDASINRIAAWVIGACNTRKALLIAGLEPAKKLMEYENKFNFTKRLAYHEGLKSYPWQIVWDYYCLQKNLKNGMEWFSDIEKYESDELRGRK